MMENVRRIAIEALEKVLGRLEAWLRLGEDRSVNTCCDDEPIGRGKTSMKTCRWCSDGPPEWSYCAKIWIHRRDRLDRRCENPPNTYGYTMQVPEETVSTEKREDA